MEQSKKKELLTTLAVLLVIVIIVSGVLFAKNNSDQKNNGENSTGTTQQVPSAASSSTVVNTAETNDSSSSTIDYKDGTYTATGNYSTPEGIESVTVNVTLAGDKVTATSAEASMKSRDSKEYAGQFLEHYQSLVVGRDIDEIKLSRVSGSSLTSQGFNSAIEQIKDQAQS